MYRNEKGLTMVHLVVIIIIIIVIVSIGVYLGEDLLTKDNLESIKTDMMKIEGKAILIADEHEMDETKPLVGIPINRNEDGSYFVEADYILSEELQKVLKEHDKPIIPKDPEAEESEEAEVPVEETPEDVVEIPEALYYIWTQEDLIARGLESIKVDNIKFYIIDYRSLKVFYSVGFEGIYELEELKARF